jgi:hypothetical protein
MVPDMCQKHQSLLVHQAGYKESDPWRALVIISQVALFQAATCDDKTHKVIAGDIGRIGELGCLACYKPDAFGEVVEAAKSHELGAIKALGERWLKAASAQSESDA